MNIKACLLLNFPCCTGLLSLVLVPFAFRKAKLIVLSPHHKHFRIFFIEDYCTTDGLIFLQLGHYFLRVDFDNMGAVLFKFEKELIDLFVPILDFFLLLNFVNQVIKSFLGMLAEPA